MADEIEIIAIDPDVLQSIAQTVTAVGQQTAEAGSRIAATPLDPVAFGLMDAWLVPPIAVLAARTSDLVTTGAQLAAAIGTATAAAAQDFERNEEAIVSGIGDLEQKLDQAKGGRSCDDHRHGYRGRGRSGSDRGRRRAEQGRPRERAVGERRHRRGIDRQRAADDPALRRGHRSGRNGLRPAALRGVDAGPRGRPRRSALAGGGARARSTTCASATRRGSSTPRTWGAS